MSDTKHTPGPWRIVGADGYATAIWGPKAENVVPETAPMKQEDARLIAAAPDLLEAIERVEEAYWDNAPAVLEYKTRDLQRAFEAGWNSALADVLNGFRPVIAKATGGKE